MYAQERFKDLEREIKLKPFAKASLCSTSEKKVDPAVLAKVEAQTWLRRAVATLAEQKERIEVEHFPLNAVKAYSLPLAKSRKVATLSS